LVVGFISTFAISAYNHESCKFDSFQWKGVLGTLRKVGGFLRISSTNKTDRQNITEILLKLVLNI
jgi:hypothetical protein